MDTLIRIIAIPGTEGRLVELHQEFASKAAFALHENSRDLARSEVASIILALGSAGAFTAVASVLRAHFARYRHAALDIEWEHGSLRATGYNGRDVEQMLEVLQGKPATTTNARKSPSDAASFNTICASLQAALDRQHAEAMEKARNPDYWRNVGLLQLTAHYIAKKAIDMHIDEIGESVNVDRMLEALAIAREYYSYEYPDEDGFGAAVFHQLIRDVITVREECSLPGTLSHAELVGVDYGRRNFAVLGTYLAITPMLDECMNHYVAGRYRETVSAIQGTMQRAEPSLITANRMLRLMAVCLVHIDGAEAAKPKLKKLREAAKAASDSPHDILLMDLACGVLSADLRSVSELPAEPRAEANYWLGTYRKAAKQPGYTALLEAAASEDLELFEVVMARLELRRPLR